MTSKVLISIVLIILFAGGTIFFLNQNKTPVPQSSTPAQTQEASPTQSETQSENTITYTKDGFSPADLTIKAGTTVTWRNETGGALSVNSNPHPVHIDYAPLNIGEIQNGQSKSLVFDTPGTYGYHNHYNSSQRGTIIVQ